MDRLKALLATAMTALMLGCATPGWAQTHMENPKFIRQSEPVLGLNQEELTEALGKPRDTIGAGCMVPLQLDPNTEPVPLFGTAWVYGYQTEKTEMGMTVCVIDRHAVAVQRSMGVIEGSRIHVSNQTTFDTDLIEKAFKGELDERTHEERTIPQMDTGPKYEI